jgi:hypothetical protein
MTNLVPYTAGNLTVISKGVSDGSYSLALPPAGGPTELNAINIAAYTIIKEGMFDLKPREMGFLGNMTKANAVTKKQRKYLCDLFLKHVGYSLYEEIEEKMAA